MLDEEDADRSVPLLSGAERRCTPIIDTNAISSTSGPIAAPFPVSPSSYRYPVTILALCWGVAFLASVDRVAMSVTIMPMSEELNFTESIKGQVSSLFSVGYSVGILPTGILLSSTSSSPRLVMSAGILLWSLATLFTTWSTIPISRYIDRFGHDNTKTPPVLCLLPLLTMRMMVGAAEAIVLPTIYKILTEWIPHPDKKSFAVAIVFSGFQFGTVASYILTPLILNHLGGWRVVFILYGVLSMLLTIPWSFALDKPPTNLLPRDSSEQFTSTLTEESGSEYQETTNCTVVESDCSISNGNVEENSSKRLRINMSDTVVDDHHEERSLGSMTDPTSLREAIAAFRHAPFKRMLFSPGVQGIVWTQSANDWGLFNSLAWTPTFFSEQYGFGARDSALLALLPSISGAIFGFIAGTVADSWIRCYPNQITKIRKVFQGIALYGPAVCLGTLFYHIPRQFWISGLLLMGSFGLRNLNVAGLGPAAQEKSGPRYAGLLYSFTALPGTLFGSLGVFITGAILDTTNRDWSIVYGVNATVCAFGATIFILLYDGVKEFD